MLRVVAPAFIDTREGGKQCERTAEVQVIWDGPNAFVGCSTPSCTLRPRRWWAAPLTEAPGAPRAGVTFADS